jgi:hypothetical protein
VSPIRRFVTPNVARLPLSGGDYIDINRELNAGQEQRVFARMVKEMKAGERATLDPERVGRTKLAEYIVGWSFVDDAGQPVPFSEDALTNLTRDTYNELAAAIETHEAAMEKEKNAPAGENKSAATSPSVA